MKIRVILADDHRIMREGLKLLLTKYNDIDIIADASNGNDAVELCRSLHPDIVILDIQMPRLSGIEACKIIKREFPEIKVIILSMYSDRKIVEETMTSGAQGYLLKDCAFEELHEAIYDIFGGKKYMSQEIAA